MKLKKAAAAILSTAIAFTSFSVPVNRGKPLMSGGLEAYAYSRGTDENGNEWVFDGSTLTYSGTGIVSVVNGSYLEGSRPDANEVKRIVLEEGITGISGLGLAKYSNLESVSLPNTLETIGLMAFEGSTSLKTIYIPDSVTTIEDYAFSNCISLENVRLSNSITEIKQQTFAKCSSLREIQIPDSIKSLGRGCFSMCDSLTSVTIPATVTHLDTAFQCCKNLESVYILNPDCEILDYKYGISNEKDENGRYVYNGTIYGYSGSTAEAYANKYERNFVAIDGSELPTSSITTTTTTTTTTSTSTTSNSTTTLKYNSVMDERILGTWIVSKTINTETGESLLDLSAADYILTFNDDFTGTTAIVEKGGAVREKVMFWTADETAAGGKDKVVVYGDDDSIPAIIDLNTMTFTDTNPKYVYYLEKKEEPAAKFGDIDGNGLINAVDASKILVKCAELSAPDAETVTEEVIAKFDINGDGLITAVDASFVLAYCAELANDPDLKIEDFIASRKK